MKFKSTIFTAISLLALVSATVDVAAPSAQQTDKIVTAALAVNSVKPSVVYDRLNHARVSAEATDSCLICFTAINTCMGKCGGGNSCKNSCSCSLKEKNSLCAECGSVTCDSPPSDIHVQHRSEDVQDVCNHCYFKPHVDECKNCDTKCDANDGSCAEQLSLERQINTGSTSQSIQDRSTQVEAVERGVVPPSPCITCAFAINHCKKKCTTPGACDDSCRCQNAMHNPFCSTCSIPCPRLARRQRRISDELAKRAIPIEHLDDPHAHEDESNNLANDEDPETNIVYPGNPASECILAVNSCKGRCATRGACDSACNCYYKGTKKCKGIKLECK